MRVIHLLRRPAGDLARRLVASQVSRGDRVTVVLLTPEASCDERGIGLLDGPGREGGMDAGELHDLLFENRQVVSW